MSQRSVCLITDCTGVWLPQAAAGHMKLSHQQNKIKTNRNSLIIFRHFVDEKKNPTGHEKRSCLNSKIPEVFFKGDCRAWWSACQSARSDEGRNQTKTRWSRRIPEEQEDNRTDADFRSKPLTTENKIGTFQKFTCKCHLLAKYL